MYVTLEPCGHHGRTPPCTQALVAAQVASVHYALLDPDPQVCGSGERRLREAGIAAQAGDGADEATRLLEGYLKHRRTGMPFVIAKSPPRSTAASPPRPAIHGGSPGRRR